MVLVGESVVLEATGVLADHVLALSLVSKLLEATRLALQLDPNALSQLRFEARLPEYHALL